MNAEPPGTDADADASTSAGPSTRRTTGDQRRYNRRAPVSEHSPPYYDVFVRIAVALEGIAQSLDRRVVDVERRQGGAARS